ncbi:MAG: hypothetical protein JW751_24090 [Polyangiaceae bacterium]|nr:hypothetical protein [Polyangiaceae bacterium]
MQAGLSSGARNRARQDAERPGVNDPFARLSRLLEAAREASRAEVVAIADPTGCLVAGAGAWADCEELAAVAPFLLGLLDPGSDRPRAANDTRPNRYDVMARRREVRRLCIDGLEVLLCGEGDPDSRRIALEEAATSCRVAFGRGIPHR